MPWKIWLEAFRIHLGIGTVILAGLKDIRGLELHALNNLLHESPHCKFMCIINPLQRLYYTIDCRATEIKLNTNLCFSLIDLMALQWTAQCRRCRKSNQILNI